MSLGGFATWDLVRYFPNYFAAAVPLCAGGGTDAPYSFVNTPIWIYHGTADKAVPFTNSESTYNSIIKAGGKLVKFTVLENKEHDAWNYAYQDRAMFCWMFEQNKSTNQTLEYTYINPFELVLSDGKTIITEKDIAFISHKTTNNEDYMDIKFTAEAFKSITDNSDGVLTVIIAGQELYSFKFKFAPENRTVRILNTLDTSQFNNLYCFLRITSGNRQLTKQ